MAKIIQLTQNQTSIIDDEDFEKINQFNWYYGKNSYATRDIKINKKRKSILLHREIINCLDNQMVDHINGNTLDNRKENLRICTKSQNGMNRGKQKNNTSGYKGVHFYKANKKWQAYISYNSKR